MMSAMASGATSGQGMLCMLEALTHVGCLEKMGSNCCE